MFLQSFKVVALMGRLILIKMSRFIYMERTLDHSPHGPAYLNKDEPVHYFERTPDYSPHGPAYVDKDEPGQKKYKWEKELPHTLAPKCQVLCLQRA
jgi:hypothetical protein